MRTGNWTADEQKKVIDAYLSGVSVDELVTETGRSKRSIQGKLVAEKVYVVPEKPKNVKKDDGPSKKEILNEIAATGFDVDGLDNATKSALGRLLERFEELSTA